MAVATIGLTGGIACGKSTVAGFFAELGVPIVDADRIARAVVAPGTDGLAEIVRELGPGVLTADGSLDRKKLADRVFADDATRAKLNAITHPRIAAESAQRIVELEGSGAPYVIYEAALLVETGIHRALSVLVVVTVPPDVQLRRLTERDELDEDGARARIAAQLPLSEKVKAADYVIDNGGSRDATRARTREVHAELSARFGGET